MKNPNTRDECSTHREAVGEPFAIPISLDVRHLPPYLQVHTVSDAIDRCVHEGYSLCAHSLDVASLAEALAGFLEWSGPDRQAVTIAAFLHDAGKLLTPLSVLGETERLSPEQWREMQRHPHEGAALLPHPDLAKIASAIRCHHEWPGGGGYPLGIMLDDIPQWARLISVVDWYAAIRERRHYRPAQPHPVALEWTWDAVRAGKLDGVFAEALERMLAVETWNPHSGGHAPARWIPSTPSEWNACMNTLFEEPKPAR